MMHPFALIVEDDSKLAEIFSEAVKAAGYDTAVSSNGRTAIEALQTQTPALILLDLHLPDVSGSEVLAYIQQEPRLQKAVVMLTTADAWQAETLRAGVDFVLMKPISFIQLRDLAARLRHAS